MPTLRIATVNLLHGVDIARGTVDTSAGAAAVARLDADVVALQEVDRDVPRSGHVDQVAAVAEAMGGHGLFAPALSGDPDHAWQPAADGPADGPSYGVGLVSRWPVLTVRRVRLRGGGAGRRSPRASPTRPGYDREPRVALRALLDVAGHRLLVTTTHLSYLPWRGAAQLRHVARLAAPGAAHARDGGAAADTAAAASDDLAAPEPAVLIGDLNLPTWAVRALTRPAGAHDPDGGWRHAGGTPTYPAWRPRWQPDQLLLRGPVALQRVVVGPALTADHLPLVATLQLDGG